MSEPDLETGTVVGQEMMTVDVLTIDEIGKLLTNSILDLDRLLENIIIVATQRMGFRAGALWLIDEESGDLVIRASYGLGPRFLELAPTFESRSRFTNLIKNHGVLQIMDVSRQPDLLYTDATLLEGIVSLVAVGLYHDNKIIGALSVYADTAHEFTVTEVSALRVIANYASIALQLTMLHKVQIDAVLAQKELELAATIQAGVLPQKMPVYEGLRIAAKNQSWEAVGGDFFDFIELPHGNLGITIGDVSGKGISAALLMFAVRMALRSHVEHEYSVRELMRRVNIALCKDTKANQFATLFYGVLNVPSKVLTFVNAGHPPPLLLRNGLVYKLETGGVPVGIMSEFTFQEEAFVLQSDDVLVFYTDGYTDVANSREDYFDMDRFTTCVSACRHLNPEQIIEKVDLELLEFIGNEALGDDRTIIVLKLD